MECPFSLVDIPDAASLKPGSFVLVTLTTSTNQPSRIFIAHPASAELPSVRGIVLASNVSDRKVSIRLRSQKSAQLLDKPADRPFFPAAGCCVLLSPSAGLTIEYPPCLVISEILDFPSASAIKDRQVLSPSTAVILSNALGINADFSAPATTSPLPQREALAT